MYVLFMLKLTENSLMTSVSKSLSMFHSQNNSYNTCMNRTTYNFYFNIIAGCSLVLRRILAIKKKSKSVLTNQNKAYWTTLTRGLTLKDIVMEVILQSLLCKLNIAKNDQLSSNSFTH